MQIAILSSSPKSDDISLSNIFIEYIIKQFPAVTFKVFKISKSNNNHDFFDTIIDNVNNSNGIIWIYPVYIGFIPSQMKKFIEHIISEDRIEAFHKKYVLNICTSANFSDITAINYIHAICDDFKMYYIDDYSISTSPPLKEDIKINLIKLLNYYLRSITEKIISSPKYNTIKDNNIKFISSNINIHCQKSNKYKILLITDYIENNNLIQMIKHLVHISEYEINIVNLNHIKINGGCTGCLQCTIDSECIYNDQFTSFYNEKVITADSIIFAVNIKDRGLSSKFLQFVDREFFYNHIPVHKEKKIAFILSNNYKDNSNIKEIIDLYSNVRGATLVDVISDEDNQKNIEINIKNLYNKLIWSLENNYEKPHNFYAVGLLKIMRDKIYVFRENFYQDYKYYKKNGLLVYPTDKSLLYKIKDYLSFFTFLLTKNKKKIIKTKHKNTAIMIRHYLR